MRTCKLLQHKLQVMRSLSAGREHEVKGRTSSIAVMGVEDAQEGTSSSTISEDVHGLRKGGHVCPV